MAIAPVLKTGGFPDRVRFPAPTCRIGVVVAHILGKDKAMVRFRGVACRDGVVVAHMFRKHEARARFPVVACISMVPTIMFLLMHTLALDLGSTSHLVVSSTMRSQRRSG